MKRLFVSILFLSVIHASFSQNADAEKIKKLNEQWMASYPIKDTATLSRIFADDLILISPSGSKMTKQEILSNVVKQVPVTVKIDSAAVRMLSENIGVIDAYVSFSSMDKPQEIIGRTCYQDVYIKRKGIWLAIAAHVTSLK